MEIFESIILGGVQGLTEFLPVSSSGHLQLAKELMGVELEENLAFDVTLHAATVLSTIVVLWSEIWWLLRGIFTRGMNDEKGKVRQSSLSILFQDLRLFGELTALENVEIKSRIGSMQSLSTIKRWFEQMGIADKLNSRIDKMSYGQQQRVALIRALCQPIDFLLLDEPISHLDDRNSDIMRDIILEETHRQGAAIIATSIGKHMDINYDKCLKL